VHLKIKQDYIQNNQVLEGVAFEFRTKFTFD